MLFDMLDQVVRKISTLDIQQEAPLFAQEMLRTNPEPFENMRKTGSKGEEIQLAARAVAAGYLKLIKEIPQIVQVMINKINDPRTEPALSCAIVGVLAYLVAPRDLINDDAPGGYGYVDDCLLLRVAFYEYLNITPTGETEQQKKYLDVFAICLPPKQLGVFQQAVDGITQTFHFLRALPPDMISITTQQIVMNPLSISSTIGTPGAMPGQATPQYSGYSFPKGGGSIYTEGESVSMQFAGGGGASMTANGDILCYE